MSRRRAFAAVALGTCLVAASCGGDDGGEATSGQVAEGVKEGAQALGGTSTTASDGPTTTVKHPASMAEWEQLWEKERAAVVKRIKDNRWGLSADGKTITGPEGFTIDLTKCPAGWSNTEGLTDTEIKIGHPTPFSGTFADASNYSKGGWAIMDAFSQQGYLKDSQGKTRKIELLMRDDGYDPARNIPLTDEMLDNDKVFAIWGIGTPSVLKTYDKINQRCVPHPFAVTGHPAWGDPVNHPWTTGSLLAYNTEAVLWGTFIDQRIDELTEGDGKATIAALITSNDFGKSYELGFRSYLVQSPNKDRIEFVSETIEASAPTVTDPMTNLAAKNPDMFIQMLGGTACAQTITESKQNGMTDKAKYMMAASVCKSSSIVGDKAVGNASDGWWVVGGGFRDINSPAEDNTPWIQFARQQMEAQGYDRKTAGLVGAGAAMGFMWVQSLKVGGELDGGLTRANLITAVRAMDMTNPGYFPGVKWNYNGNKDAYGIEGTELGRWDHSKQSWIQQGDIIDLSGKSSNCAWDLAASTCR